MTTLTLASEERQRRLEQHMASETEKAVAMEAARAATAVQEYASLVSSLSHEVEVSKREKISLQETAQQFAREIDLLKNQERSVGIRLAALESELVEKNRSLETVLGQLERAELKAAKEARKRMDAERMLKRLDTSVESLVLAAPVPSLATATPLYSQPQPQTPTQTQTQPLYRSSSQAPNLSMAARADRAVESNNGIQARMKERFGPKV